MLKYLVPLAVFVALGVFLWSGLGRNPGDLPSPLIGKQAPEFKTVEDQRDNRSTTGSGNNNRPSTNKQ